MPTSHNKFAKVALILWFFAVIQSAMAITGIVNINDTSAERVLFGVIELTTMALLLLNALAIMRYTAKQSCVIAHRFSKLCLYSLFFCFAGDIVNRNFPQLFYQYDNVIKHSYLADSVIFFFPGYFILVLAIAHLAIKSGLSSKLIIVTTVIATTLAVMTYHDMHLTSVSNVLTLITASYAILVSILAVSTIWLIIPLMQYKVPPRIWGAALGLVLAMVADALIGKYWIFGNQGQGYFPLVSHVNWIVYFTSQVLIQQLPIGLLQMKLPSK
ncbi:MAG: hypothetical protein WBC60_00460 [Cognaticolwellia sp.]